MDKPWFRSKKYGYGWEPATWQGWLVVLVFIVYVGYAAFGVKDIPDDEVPVWFLVKIGFAIFALILVCIRTGEPLKWRWGKDKK